MKVVIRTDASTRIGSGHVMRCLTLAEALKARGVKVFFICREHTGSLCDLIEEKGFTIFRLPAPADHLAMSDWNDHAAWLGISWEQDGNETLDALKTLGGEPDLIIVDHYALDHHWGWEMRPFVKKIMVIDDLADRDHDCDFLLDQNLYLNIENRYEGLVPKTCKIFLGPQYALLRPEFRTARENKIFRDGSIRRILVFLGGSDPDNVTGKVLNAFILLDRNDIKVDVVLGPQNRHFEEIYEQITCLNYVNIHENVKNMATLMNRADFMIGSGGTTTWERCCMGLPSLIISIAENQIEISKALDSYGAASYLGSNEKVNSENIGGTLQEMLNDPVKVKLMSNSALELVDGMGTERVLKEMMR